MFTVNVEERSGKQREDIIMEDGLRLHVRVEYHGGSTGVPGELECDIDVKKPADVALKQVS